MAFGPIALTIPNYRDFNGYFLKAFIPPTTTPKVMATDATGTTTVSKFELDKDGFPKTSGGALITPYIDGPYDLWAFPTEAEADANDTSNALRFAINVETADSATINDLSQSYTFKTVTLMQASLIVFPVGKKIFWQGYLAESNGGSNWGLVKSGAHTDDGGSEFDLADGKFVAANLKGKRLNVLKFGVTNDEVDTLARMNVVKVFAADNGFTQYFPDGVYGISDRYTFADGGNTYFELNTEISLLQASVGGAAISGPFPAQTKIIVIDNLTINCNNIAGQNGGGFGHITGMFLNNLKVKNVLHSTSILGGKAVQFEGTAATHVRIPTLDLENCSVGLDFGAVAAAQEVDIQIGAVTMRDVDIPVFTNDTTVSFPSDDPDKLDVTIQSLTGRNCGRLQWAGSDPIGGGIIVGDRGGWLSINYIKIVNDMGGFGSTAYGTIGALCRGTMVGIRLGDVELISDCTALFDFNVTTFQFPTIASIPSYVTTARVNHIGNLDRIIQTNATATSIGPCMLDNVIIDGTAASLTNIMDFSSSKFKGAFLNLIDSSDSFKTSGLKSFFDLDELGNTLATTLGVDSSAMLSGSWTPIDASGAGLVFVIGTGTWVRQANLVTLFGQITYPATADVSAAKIGGFPFTTKDEASSRSGASVNLSTNINAQVIYPMRGSTEAPILTNLSAGATNADISGVILEFTITYMAIEEAP